ncbi:MAG: molybdopterin-dependent oxidoreductase [Myxococcales bacterium]|nr:molybdopterin-dependent oxidoreductase [Myxococcales bacterium]MCB9714050.1 molybdopterin-dependent oxidoreductase [Myxococcales bacterium]
MTDQRRSHRRTCSLCEAMCGLVLEVEGERVVSVRGDEDDPRSRGYLCPKGPALAGLHADPDRLRSPLRRTASGWEPVGWEEALDEAAERLHEAQSRHGRDAVATYVGNPAVHNTGSILYYPSFAHTLRTRHRYSATSVDQLPQMLAAFLMFGHQLLMPIPDIDRSEHMILLGANPLVSNGSIMSAPDVKRRLGEIQARGGRVVVIDPRRSETARVADEHLFIRPGADAWLLLAMVHVLFDEDLVRLGAAEGLVRNLDRLRELARAFPPERAAGPTGIAAEDVRRLTRQLAAAPRAVLYGRVGVSMHPFGSVCHWLVNAINLLTGNLDRPGGHMFTHPAFDIVGLREPLGIGAGSFGRWRSKVRGLPEFGGELPVATLAEDIRAGGDPPIRALLTLAGNPVLSAPNGPALEAALGELDFMVSIDFYLNETTRHAHLILPPSGPLEHGHYDVAFHVLSVRNSARYCPPIFEIGAEQRHDHQILAGLERRLLRLRGAPRRGQALVRLRERLGPERLLEIGLRVGPQGFGGGVRQGLRGPSMARLRAAPHGIDLGPLRPALPERLPTRRGGVAPHIDLAPEALVADLGRLEQEGALEPEALRLIGRRQLRSNNSWMHNIPKLIAGKARCTLLIHRDDASRLGIADGQEVEIRSRVGTVVAPAEVGTEVMPGVVSLPHGFGHHRPGTRLGVAAGSPGVSINDVTDDQRVDGVSGVAAFSGVPVTVRPVAPATTADDGAPPS